MWSRNFGARIKRSIYLYNNTCTLSSLSSRKTNTSTTSCWRQQQERDDIGQCVKSHFNSLQIQKRSFSVLNEKSKSNHHHHENVQGQDTHDSMQQSLEKRTNELLDIFSFSGTKRNTTLTNFDELMQDWAQLNTMHAARRAEELLTALETNYDQIAGKRSNDNGNYDTKTHSQLIPNSLSYNHVLKAYTQSQGGMQAAMKAEEILLRMIDRHESVYDHNSATNLSPSPEPSLSSFNTVLNAWAKSKSHSAGIKAEEIYTLLELKANDDNQRYPNAQSLATVFDAWAHSSHEGAVERVMTTLHHVIEKERLSIDNGEDRLLRLNKIVFHSALLTLAKFEEGGVSHGNKAEKIVKILQNLHEQDFYSGITDRKNKDDEYKLDIDLKPDTRTWSLLLRCWANVANTSYNNVGEDAAEHAELLLMKMEEMYNAGEGVRPNAHCFTSCIQAWSKLKSKKSTERAIDILSRKEKLFEMTGDEEIKPNSFEYNVCLSALCNANLMGDARNLLTKMESAALIDTTSYNTVISAYTKLGDMKQAWNLMNQMKEHNIYLDVVTYNTIMDAIGRLRDKEAIDKIIQILNMMTDSENIQPNVRSFTIALNAIAKSQLNNKIDPARKIFRQIIVLQETSEKKPKITLDVAVFGAFLSCCSNENQKKRDALKLALGTYEQLRSCPDYGRPNEYIYAAMMKASYRFTHDAKERNRLLETLFVNCRNEGNVSRKGLTTFLKQTESVLQERLLKDCRRHNNNSSDVLDSKYISIPSKWCSNVPKSRKPHTI